MAKEQTYSNAEIEAGRKLFSRPFSFIKGCVKIDDLPIDDKIEIAFAGRSNVGKSSLINALVGMKSLARTSNTPGRTQELNIFENNMNLRLIDMPGYGYAKAPKPKVEAWNKLIHAYLRGRANLRRVYILIDGRHGAKASDASLMNELDKIGVSYQIIITKSDKPNKNELNKAIKETYRQIAKRPAAYPNIIISSSHKKEGIDLLRAEIAKLLENKG